MGGLKLKKIRKILFGFLCIFVLNACSLSDSKQREMITETDNYGNEVVEVDINDLSESQLEELKEDGVLLADSFLLS